MRDSREFLVCREEDGVHMETAFITGFETVNGRGIELRCDYTLCYLLKYIKYFQINELTVNFDNIFLSNKIIAFQLLHKFQVSYVNFLFSTNH